MPRRCLDCPDWKVKTEVKEVKKETKIKGKKKFCFPKSWIVVYAKDLMEAEEMIKALKEQNIETK